MCNTDAGDRGRETVGSDIKRGELDVVRTKMATQLVTIFGQRLAIIGRLLGQPVLGTRLGRVGDAGRSGGESETGEVLSLSFDVGVLQHAGREELVGVRLGLGGERVAPDE